MSNLLRKMIDLYDDIEFSGMKKIAFEGNLPQRVKSMKYLTNGELDKLADHDFALVKVSHEGKVRRYPINDYENTWVSTRYFDDTRTELNDGMAKEAALKLHSACRFYGIQDIPNSVKNPSIEKRAESVQSICALHNRYPINDEREVKLATEYFCKYASSFDPADRHEYCKNVQKRAEELNVDLGDKKDSLNKYASSTMNPAYTAYMLQRKELVTDPEQSNLLEKMAHVNITNESIEKLAQIIDQFDRKNNLSQYWDTHIKDPYASVYGLDKTAASEEFKAGAQTFTDVELKGALSKHSKKFNEYIGASAAKMLGENPRAVFDSLPMPTKEVVANIVKGLI